MLRLLLSLIALLGLASCSKETILSPTLPKVLPTMHRVDLAGQYVKYGAAPVALDLDQDGKNDFLFGIMLVGDPVYRQDKYQFRVYSAIDRLLAVNASEETPSMSYSSKIPVESFNGFQWYDIASLVLIQKVVTDDAPPYWEGTHHKGGIQYLPVQMLKQGKRYNGWISLSADIANERLLLHAAAISNEAEIAVLAGQ